MITANLDSKTKYVDDRFCPMCDTPYERTRWSYTFNILDRDQGEGMTLFFSESSFECRECGYTDHKNSCTIGSYDYPD